MENRKSNIVLIGMPGCGKSTVGVLLAKRLGMHFVDTDLFIQAGEGKSLRRLIEVCGVNRFCEIERDYVERVNVTDSVIATGGSVVYYDSAMQHLKKSGQVTYLQIPLAELEKRLGDLNARGVVLEPTETLASLYHKRMPLYKKWADKIVDLAAMDHEQSVDAVVKAIK